MRDLLFPRKMTSRDCKCILLGLGNGCGCCGKKPMFASGYEAHISVPFSLAKRGCYHSACFAYLTAMQGETQGSVRPLVSKTLSSCSCPMLGSWVPYPALLLTPNSACTHLERSQWWFKQLDSCQPARRPGLSWALGK